MFFTLLAFFNAQAYPSGDPRRTKLIADTHVFKRYHSDINKYKNKNQVDWPQNTTLDIQICNGAITEQQAILARNFWNNKPTKNKIKNIYNTSNCEPNKRSDRNTILITRQDSYIKRQSQWGVEITYSNTKEIAYSYIELHPNIPQKLIQSIITHEIGHSLGYAHCHDCRYDDIMHH